MSETKAAERARLDDVPAAGGSASTGKVGVYLALLQLFFTLGWTVYVVYLPQLAAKVGLPATAVIIILLVDQAVFTITDTLMGIAADRMTPIVGRLSRIVIWLTVVSCAAFVALPFVADLGPNAKIALIALTLVWAVTSSALRAPPLALLGKFAARPSIPMLSCLVMLGYGIAGAVSPYLGVVLRSHDPRIPFVVSTIVLLLTALSMSWIERRLREGRLSAPERAPVTVPKSYGALALIFIVAMLVLALGYQLHFSINSAPLFLRFAKQPDLQWLMPVYWIGFNIAMFPASFITRRLGGLLVIGCAGLLGAGAVFGMENAGGLNTMIVMQFMAGAAWGCILMSAVAAAIAVSGGAEGKVLGLMFSAIALATFTRIATVAGGLSRNSAYEALLQWTPVLCWALAGAALLFIAVARLRKWRQGENPANVPV
ncbi:MFS transporter [Bradyrhizobium sp. G127]|uniref:MFS transporter n=1 Tax=Bradyrhizobium sp. G127 TaxID=2904800 RepID=UPI001F406111|nr:MFS transporter [Bradyrhizobium sp. G127]MCF2524529.1 MFS transporter [Bradyrhizobium sp. G127]